MVPKQKAAVNAKVISMETRSQFIWCQSASSDLQKMWNFKQFIDFVNKHHASLIQEENKIEL